MLPRRSRSLYRWTGGRKKPPRIRSRCEPGITSSLLKEKSKERAVVAEGDRSITARYARTMTRYVNSGTQLWSPVQDYSAEQRSLRFFFLREQSTRRSTTPLGSPFRSEAVGVHRLRKDKTAQLMSLTAVDLEDSNRLPLCTSHLRIQSLSLSHAELSQAE